MRVWRIKQMREDAAGQSFLQKPTARKALNAFEAAKTIPRESWSVLCVLGAFLAAYKGRYFRSWKGNQQLLLELYDEMKFLCNREGIEEASYAVEAVFSEKLKWVSAHRSFLLSQKCYTNYIVPVTCEMRNAQGIGEQSEWVSRSSDPVKGSRVVKW